MKFNILNQDALARVGELHFSKGVIQTPVFMPVGTYGTVKTMTPDELLVLGAEIILGNTYHLMVRPGEEVISLHKGLHNFMGCLLYTSPSPRDLSTSRKPSSA